MTFTLVVKLLCIIHFNVVGKYSRKPKQGRKEGRSQEVTFQLRLRHPVGEVNPSTKALEVKDRPLCLKDKRKSCVAAVVNGAVNRKEVRMVEPPRGLYRSFPPGILK